MQSKTWKLILLCGVIAGTFDVAFATIFNGLRGLEPIKVWQSVAAGLLGRAAYDGGVGTALLGLLCHYCIMTGAAAVFVLASRKLLIMRTQTWLPALVFGVAMYCVMSFVILPLSAFPYPFRLVLWVMGANLAAHVLLVGLPFSLLTRRASL